MVAGGNNVQLDGPSGERSQCGESSIEKVLHSFGLTLFRNWRGTF